MNKMFSAVALSLAMNVTAIAPSFAQTAAPAGRMMGVAGGGCPMMGMMGQGMMGRRMTGQHTPSGHHDQMGSLADRRLAHLKTELKITNEQAEVWKAYVDAIKDRVKIMQGLHTTMIEAMDKAGAVERIDIRIKSMEAMVEAMKAVKPATERLYVALTADQKKVADRRIGIECGAM
jgi:hypothetical protein